MTGPASGPSGQLRQQLAALRGLYPDWDIWTVPTPWDLAGQLTWLARLAGSAIPCCYAKDPYILGLAICLYADRLHEHLITARVQLASLALAPERRIAVQGQADAITRLLARDQPPLTRPASGQDQS